MTRFRWSLSLATAIFCSASVFAQSTILEAVPDVLLTDNPIQQVGYTHACPTCNVACSGNTRKCSCRPAADKPASPCAGSHKGLFYNNNFDYLKDPCYSGNCLGDCLKNLPIACGRYGTMDIGGQVRLRYHHEEGMGRQPGRLGFQDTQNDFLLSRLRVYNNWKVNDWLRFYAEGIVADVSANDLYVPRPIDENSGDLLNLFVDVKLTDNASVRVGRQELMFGSQRLVSPLDWANTRRTFEGIRATLKIGAWTVDPFYTNFVPVSKNDFDEADYDRSFYGVYASRKAEGQTIDMYYLGFDNQTTAAAVSTDFSLHTFGGRVNGKFKDTELLYDLEGAYQSGQQSGLGANHSAGFVTVGLGRQFKEVAWKPTAWMYYDFASGNDSTDGAFNRFNQLFPLAHKYLGFIDAAARSNISSPNFLLTASPSKKLKLLAWYYYLGANQENDIIPGVALPAAQNLESRDFGNELDLIANYTIGPRSNIIFGYSNLWRGNKIIGTNNAEFFYTQYTLNF